MDPLELETRRRLFEHVRRHPGKYLRELQRDVGLGMGALEYHLDFLEGSGLVTVLQDGNKRFYPADLDRNDKRVIGFLRQELPRRCLLLISRNGPTSKSRLLEELDVAASTLNHHLRHLLSVGLVEVEREGRDAVYQCRDPDRITRLLVMHRASLMDRMVDRFLDGIESMRTRPPASQIR